MATKLQCPKCSRAVSAKPLKAWSFGQYDVKRYQCDSCKSKFNLYQRPGKSYTIEPVSEVSRSEALPSDNVMQNLPRGCNKVPSKSINPEW
jgi:transcriptional regulator NrdR family protein